MYSLPRNPFNLISAFISDNGCFFDANALIKEFCITLILRSLFWGIFWIIFLYLFKASSGILYSLLLINCDLSANIRETEFEINSDKYGCINADYIITCKEAGDLTVSSYYVDQENELLILDRQFKIDNCSMGEIITINGASQLVTSNINGRQLGKARIVDYKNLR